MRAITGFIRLGRPGSASRTNVGLQEYEGTHGPRRFESIANFILVAASLVLAVIVAEVGLRILLTAKQQVDLPHAFVDENRQRRLAWLERHADDSLAAQYGFDAHDPLLGWQLRSQVSMRSVKEGSYDVTVTSNAQGLRGARPVPERKPEGVIRIGIFGDSLTFGEGVNDQETYSAQLQDLLPGYEVLNFGVHGYGTDQMLLYYLTEGQRYDLDVVILAFAWFHLARNVTDFSFYAKPHFELDGDELRLHNTPVPQPQTLLHTMDLVGGHTLGDYSVLARWVWQRILNVRERRLYRADSFAWTLTNGILTHFARNVQAAGSNFVIMNIDENHPKMDGVLAELAAELNVELIDLASRLRSLNAAGIDYRLLNDGHWNATGHRLVAAELRQHICHHDDRSVCNENDPKFYDGASAPSFF